MATVAGESASYGGGAGGKFRKRPFRRAQTTPYDRPPTALRSTWRNTDNSSNGGNGGWLSRIVDPASKLISSSAHKLFSSVFRMRLLPPPPQPSRDEKVEPSDNHVGDVMKEHPSRIQETNEGNTQINSSVTDGVAELENILKQKTFTRSEIDRLVVLLHSRMVEKTGVSGPRRLERTSSELPVGDSRQEGLDGFASETGVNPSEVPGTDLTPALRSKVGKVDDDDITSPAELAKTYMGSRSTRLSPSMIVPRSLAVREESPAFTTFQLQRPCVSTAHKPLSTAGTSQNDFLVPRSRGRSAIYSMARTPYSRVQPIAIKGLGTRNDAFNERSLLSSQKVLKRRYSVMENDTVSVGPIRRIRQKPNLLYPKTSGLPSSRTPLSHTTPSEVGEASLYSSSKSKENRSDKSIPLSSSHVPSKSIEMGQRILQQLEKLTPPKEKSSEKKSAVSGGMSAKELTPAMLHGQARKSSETVHSLKFLQNDQVSGKIVDSLDVMLDSTSKKQDKVYERSSKLLVSSSNNFFPENEARTTDNTGVAKTTAPMGLKSAADVPKKSRAFQMSAYQDHLELDDDAHSNGVASALVNEDTRNLKASSIQSNGSILPENPLPEATKADAPPAFPELKTSSNSVLKSNTVVAASSSAERAIDRRFPTDSALQKRIGSSAPLLQPVTTSVSDKADVSASNISFGLKSSEMVSPISSFSSSSMESSISMDEKLQCASSVFAFAAGSTNSALKSPGSNNKITNAVDLFKKSDSTPLSSVPGSTASTFLFGMSANTPTGNISSFSSCPVTSSAPSPVLFSPRSASSGSFAQSTFTTSTATTKNTGVSATKVVGDAADSATATISSSTNSPTSSIAFPSFQPGLAFGASSVVASDSAAVATFGAGTADKSKETALSNSTSSSFSGAMFAMPPSSTVSFQFGASMTSSTNSQLQASHNISGRSTFGDQILPSATASASKTESTPSHSGASVLPASSGSTSQAASSGVNQFGSLTSVSPPFSSSSIFGSISSGSSLMAASGSASSPSTSIFGSCCASTPSNSASSAFAFRTSSTPAPANGTSPGLPFGASSSSASSTPSSSASSGFAFGTSISAPANGNSSVFAFGASSAAPSSTATSTFSFGASSASSTATPAPIFPFGSTASAPAMGNANSVFAFGSTPSPSSLGNNVQMNTEDSMVEDSMQSPTPTGSVFGQSPTSSFTFGSTPAPSGANPFQFGSQQNQGQAPQNPFQASGSFDGGSFSLGAGGTDKSNRRIVKVRHRNKKK